jgi:hypothetical protein
MSGEGAVRAFAACFGCAVPFWFDPQRVPAIPIDPVTALPPDLGGDPARAVNRPLCPDCRRAANPRRIAAGLAPWPEG